MDAFQTTRPPHSRVVSREQRRHGYLLQLVNVPSWASMGVYANATGCAAPSLAGTRKVETEARSCPALEDTARDDASTDRRCSNMTMRRWGSVEDRYKEAGSVRAAGKNGRSTRGGASCSPTNDGRRVCVLPPITVPRRRRGGMSCPGCVCRIRTSPGALFTGRGW